MNIRSTTFPKLAQATRIQQTRISEIIKGTRSVTADTAIHLGRFFSVTPQFWLNLQAMYDLEKTCNQKQEDYNRIRAYNEPQAGLVSISNSNGR